MIVRDDEEGTNNCCVGILFWTGSDDYSVALLFSHRKRREVVDSGSSLLVAAHSLFMNIRISKDRIILFAIAAVNPRKNVCIIYRIHPCKAAETHSGSSSSGDLCGNNTYDEQRCAGRMVSLLRS